MGKLLSWNSRMLITFTCRCPYQISPRLGSKYGKCEQKFVYDLIKILLSLSRILRNLCGHFCAEYYPDWMKNVETSGNNLENVCFTAPIFTKLTVIQRHCVEFLRTEFHRNRSRNMSSTGGNSLTLWRQVLLSQNGLSWITRLSVTFIKNSYSDLVDIRQMVYSFLRGHGLTDWLKGGRTDGWT